jgi:acyl-coenzyme A synthetase/AMP-(fatty) acid ligase
MIKTSGYRVSPNEIEETLFASGLVSEAVAAGVADELLGQAIAVVVSPAPNVQADTEALLAFCRTQLANFMIPKHVIWMDDLPRNANGKIDRSSLTKELPELLKNSSL